MMNPLQIRELAVIYRLARTGRVLNQEATGRAFQRIAEACGTIADDLTGQNMDDYDHVDDGPEVLQECDTALRIPIAVMHEAR